MNESHRVAVIEVGSRAARLLIADVLPGERLQNVYTNWKETGLRQALEVGGLEAEERIAHLCNTLQIFREATKEHKATRIAAFGTDAIRRLAAAQVEQLRGIFPGFKVLTRRQEAELSFLAGVMRSSEVTRSSLALVLDQGSGSMEAVVGTVVSGVPKVRTYKSYDLGTTKLVVMLDQEGSFFKLRETLEKDDFRRKLKLIPPVRPIVLGSAATSAAWVTLQREPNASYDPRQVQGRVIPQSLVDWLVQIAETHPETARRLIDPHNADSKEFKTVISGLVALEVFLRGQDKTEFEVCGDGTRYGFAWKLAMSGIDGKEQGNVASSR